MQVGPNILKALSSQHATQCLKRQADPLIRRTALSECWGLHEQSRAFHRARPDANTMRAQQVRLQDQVRRPTTQRNRTLCAGQHPLQSSAVEREGKKKSTTMQRANGCVIRVRLLWEHRRLGRVLAEKGREKCPESLQKLARGCPKKRSLLT
eukprot:1231113-Pleurochrysis_carterae.AAC.2